MVQEIHPVPDNYGAKDLHGSESGLTHVWSSGEVQMVDASQESPMASFWRESDEKIYHEVKKRRARHRCIAYPLSLRAGTLEIRFKPTFSASPQVVAPAVYRST
ncbi:hypothetical protein SAY87_011150 [Trapa incisa]|uniref:Uncharacterized protein n=1 Tax=Trapa incisa TaxID=236973 RepID=A0AAN7GI47_9MYRT|nr:hypothetical protein SAY87_011150 [Trapa incisa]